VISLATAAAVHFGDLPDPAGGEPQPANLTGASELIEMLAVLEEKTRGNLTPEESQLLGQVLYELRMRYVNARGSS
jgi:hypothetical protein